MKVYEAMLRGKKQRSEDGWVATTTAIVMTAVAVAASATSAYGAYAAGQAQKKAADFNAKVAENNAVASQQQAAQQAQLIQNRNRRLRGSQEASLAAAGVDASTGSGADVMYDSGIQGELDRLTALYKGKVGANEQLSQAQLDRYSGRASAAAGMLGAGGSLLSGAGGAAHTYAEIADNPRFGTVS